MICEAGITFTACQIAIKFTKSENYFAFDSAWRVSGTV
jgi:hypothetical protein